MIMDCKLISMWCVVILLGGCADGSCQTLERVQLDYATTAFVAVDSKSLFSEKRQRMTGIVRGLSADARRDLANGLSAGTCRASDPEMDQVLFEALTTDLIVGGEWASLREVLAK